MNPSDRLSGKSRYSDYTITVPLGTELKQRGRSGSQSSSSSNGSAADRSSISTLSNEDYAERRIYGSIKTSAKRSPEQPIGINSSESDKTISFRPKLTGINAMSFRSSAKSNVSDSSSLDTEFMSLTGANPATAGNRRGESFKKQPLKLGGVSGITIMEDDEADGEYAEPSANRNNANAGMEVAGPYEDFDSYHLAYLLGVSAGAKAATEGAIGGETTDSGRESGAAGARNNRGSRQPQGDDVYLLGFKHGRAHGIPDPDALSIYDLETGEQLTLEQRIANLTIAANSRTPEAESFWDTPSRFEQFVADTVCCCRGSVDYLCCPRGCCCFNRQTVDACFVALCVLGGVVGILMLIVSFATF